MSDLQDALPGTNAELTDLYAFLLRVARQRLGRRRPDASASDFVQLALLKGYEARDSCRATCLRQQRGWLRAILINLIRGARHEGREVPLEVVPGELLAAALPDPSYVAHRNECASRLAEAVASLRDNHRRVVKLRFEHHLPFDEIGRALGKSADAVRMLLARALEKLHCLLDGLEDTY